MKKFLTLLLLCSLLFAVDNYSTIDNWAGNVPNTALTSVEDLTKYLVKPAINDTQKVRAIYDWIAQNVDYDTNEYFSGKKNLTYRNPAENTFRTRKSICYGYAELFKQMCSIAGIKAVVVNGYGKGFGYEPGKKIGGPVDHAWNVVQLKGRWYLVDSTWGAGTINSSTRAFVRDFDDFWFLTPPEQFIYTHYPEDSRWQFLDQKVSLEEFSRTPKFTPAFFRLGFDPRGHENVRLQTEGGMSLHFNIPSGTVISSGLRYWNGESLNQPSYTFERREGANATILVGFPQAGAYKLTVYAKNIRSKGRYAEIVSYRVDSSSGDPAQAMAQTFEAYSVTPVELDRQTPVRYSLQNGSKYLFKLRVPGAYKVAVVNTTDGTWQQLTRSGDVFTGEAVIKTGTLRLSANFPGDVNSYQTLIEYQAK